ncbi:FAD-binding monooxygenase [Streptosporangiaceae bacterium NEAU-GS5]|nr:FAD-binding monooxygenase [Streptosporangiaceae bacterium NEAU-GS5]
MAGLLAAGALAGAYDEVLLADRDPLPEEVSARQRRGVPHGRHAHGLLGGGLEAMEELLPGIGDDLVKAGVPVGDISANIRLCVNGRRLRPVSLGFRSLSVSRPYLESSVRDRVAALPNVTILGDHDVVGLLTRAEGNQVVGATLRSRTPDGADVGYLADLVVDATGRGSRAPVWLGELGYPAPAEERVTVDLIYTTRVFTAPADALGEDIAIIVAPTVAHPRGGVAQRLEDGKVLVTLFGILGDAAPEDLRGFLEFAATLPRPDIAGSLARATPCGEPWGFRFPASIRRRYERLDRFPAGLLALGDAVCSFNPQYGQGMSVAAQEAVVLRRMAETALDPLEFFRAIAPVVDVPWQIAVGADLAFPGVAGARTAMGRFVNAYLRRLHAAAEHDAVAAGAFIRVAHLLAPPSALFRPSVALRVLRG